MFGENKHYDMEYYNKQITKQEVKKTTQSLKSNKSTGPELIKNEFIKHGGNKRLNKLTSFFNEIFNIDTLFYFLFSLSMLRKTPCSVSKYAMDMLAYKAYLHETQKELQAVSDFKPVWVLFESHVNIILFLWQFHCSSVHMTDFN